MGVSVLADGLLRFAGVKLSVSGLDRKVQIVEGLTREDEVVVYSEDHLTAES